MELIVKLKGEFRAVLNTAPYAFISSSTCYLTLKKKELDLHNTN